MDANKSIIVLNSVFPDLLAYLLSRDFVYRSDEGNFYECSDEFEAHLKHFLEVHEGVKVDLNFDYEYYYLNQYVANAERHKQVMKLKVLTDIKKGLTNFRKKNKLNHWSSEQTIGYVIFWNHEDAERSTFDLSEIQKLLKGND